jgi:Predicted AAA-ATPase/PD-(D/E)XK nuclease superfamily
MHGPIFVLSGLTHLSPHFCSKPLTLQEKQLSVQKELPIGIQDFPKLIQGNYTYVDKTEYYHRLITKGVYYFLSRPRRFGKSLLVSTLKEIFQGNRNLFEGLWIYDKMDWEPRPVILLDFSRIVNRATNLEEGIRLELMEIASSYGATLTEGTNAGRLQELIKLLGKDRKVAILVDEYDKPLIDNIDNLDLANQNRKSLKNLYSVLKGNDSYIAFLMLTGVTKFSQVSIFSDLNNLEDITLDRDFAGMLGYTQQELETYFDSRFPALEVETQMGRADLLARIKEWYNGYSWDGGTFVYNPFSILNLLKKSRFQDYWFATGTPTFLMKLIKTQGYSVMDLQNKEISLSVFNRFDLERIEINSLLFQTGYLTIKESNYEEQYVALDFPNREVANAFSIHLLSEFAEKSQEGTDSLIRKMNSFLRQGQVDGFMQNIIALFADIANPIQPAKNSSIGNMEKYYHSMFYLVLRLLGYNIQAEVFTSNGRIDAVITAGEYIYVVEFKLGDAASALAQIKALAYHQKYLASGKKVILLGIGFDVAMRNVGEFLVEEA